MLENNKATALDWSKYYTIRCSNCKQFSGDIVDHCAIDDSVHKYSDECDAFEVVDEQKDKIGVYDRGSRRFPKFELPNGEVIVDRT
jgi:hypothetical protein